MRRKTHILCLISVVFLLAGMIPMGIQAEDSGAVDVQSMRNKVFRTTEFPLPRFVSLASDEVNVRAGPGKQFPLKWIYKRARLPVEITLEFDSWRKIKDRDGQEGWVHETLLSGKRTAFVTGEGGYLLSAPDQKARRRAFLQSGTLVDVKECRAAWCSVSTSGYSGWLPVASLWGVYSDEEFE